MTTPSFKKMTECSSCKKRVRLITIKNGICGDCRNPKPSVAARQNRKSVRLKEVKKNKVTKPSKPSCPKCKSEHITANKKGYGAAKGLGGLVLTGGVGLLAGFIGSKKVLLTCLNCGKQWKAGS